VAMSDGTPSFCSLVGDPSAPAGLMAVGARSPARRRAALHPKAALAAISHAPAGSPATGSRSQSAPSHAAVKTARLAPSAYETGGGNSETGARPPPSATYGLCG